MKKIIQSLAICVAFSGAALADGHAKWVSVADQTSVSFGSIKKDTIGEIHHFSNVTGTVDGDGAVNLEIDLTSLETYIDIRNERMAAHVFKEATMAQLMGEVDMDDVTELAVGETGVTDFEGTLNLLGIKADVEAEMLVARLSENRVLVTTADFIMLSTEDLGINKGVDKLMELAKLPSITRVTPVALRAIFEK